MTEQTSPTPDTPDVKILPPTMLVMFIAAGLVLDFIVPVNMGRWIGWLGLVLLCASFGITGWCKGLFQKAGTNVPPNKPATALVITGPYKFSRNPIYLSMVLCYAGMALIADAPLMLLLTAPLIYILQEKVIKPEEEYLQRKFGEEYMTFFTSVRRWI